MTTLLVFLVLWFATGVVLALAMRRRGHSLVPWLGLGLGFGPFAIALAVDAAHGEGQYGVQLVASPGAMGGGRVDVLVGCDGSTHSEAALRRVVDMLDDRIGRLTLAAVIDYDAAGGGPQWESENLGARRSLERAMSQSPMPVTEAIVLNGRVADALTGYAIDNGYDLLVAGARGAGLSKALLGSVAAKLSRAVSVPILLVAEPSAPVGTDGVAAHAS
ncbi:MAG TPA: universal stress protein [Acidimicrobiales bacterium]|nr:universal stress protein [Acidimicrobiales bacterium]